MKKKIRYAVVGLGSIAQEAVLPSFKKARSAELTALVSGDPKKLKELGKKYRVDKLYSYDSFNECLTSGEIDAVYIATPNTLHRRFAIEAANAGVHVLCEKPLSTSVTECQSMIDAADAGNVKLMTAYRLHLEEGNLKAIKAVHSGKIGDPLFFNASFGFLVKEDNIRLNARLGGGPLFDIGIYCINAARYLFGTEPTEVFAFAGGSGRKRFSEVDESIAATMKFPEGRLASFVCSFGSTPVDCFEVVGTKGRIELEPAFDWEGGKELTIEVKEKEKKYKFKKSGQFVAVLDYFADCILKGKAVEPSGLEGLIDVRIIQALQRSIEEGRPIRVQEAVTKKLRPDLKQKIVKPAAQEGRLINAEGPADEAA